MRGFWCKHAKCILVMFGLLATIISIDVFANKGHESPKNLSIPVGENAEIIKQEFSLEINNVPSPYDTVSAIVLPNEPVAIEISYPRPNETYRVNAKTGDKNAEKQRFTQKTPHRWVWARDRVPGAYSYWVTSENGGHNVRVNIFVKHPISKPQRDNGDNIQIGKYNIGAYPSKNQIKNSQITITPDGFIEVTKDNKHLKLSPSFSLGEFVSKQKSGYPKYLYVKERLILKLEKIKRELELNTGTSQKMVVMSGYRTPHYNKAIGNVKFSRHVYGDASDIFIDNDGDYRMDDLNHDGKFDILDAHVLADIVNKLDDTEQFAPFLGGLGIYGPKSHRGAFVHVDTRGYKARWINP